MPWQEVAGFRLRSARGFGVDARRGWNQMPRRRLLLGNVGAQPHGRSEKGGRLKATGPRLEEELWTRGQGYLTDDGWVLSLDPASS